MTQTVTELIVREDGALAVLDRFEEKMVDAGRASDRSTGAIDRYNAAMQKFAAAQERGLAITTQRIERQTAEQRAMERWQGTVDRTMRLEIQLRKEAQRAAIDMANAVALGYTSQERAMATLIGLEQRHAAQLAESAVMSQRMAGAEAVVGGRFDAATAAINRNTAALRANHTAGSFNTANIAAQFQDIGVTMAMGMSPLQIALQQGAQLSAVFELMKASGQSVAVGLRSAFLSVVSPISLVTVGVIAATAAIVQWATSAEDESDKASKALEAHADIISRIKEKYGEAAKELKAYADESAVILKAAAIQAREANEAIVSEASQDVVNKMLNMPGSAFGAGTPLLSSFSKALSDLESSLAAGTPRLLEFRNAMASIRTSDYATAEQKALADSFLEMTKEAEKAARSLPSSAAAIEMTGNRARTSTTDVEGFAKALRDLAGIAVPALTDAERAQDALRKALAGASDIVERKAALDAYHDTLVRINNEIEGAKVPIPTARPNDIERLDGEAKAAGKAEESYDRLFDSAQRRLDQMQTELGLIGQAGAAVESYRMEQDLLSRAKEREIDLSQKQRDEIHALAQAYGEVAQAIAEARLASELMFDRAQLGRSDEEQHVADAMRRLYGDDYGKYMDSALAGEIRLNEALRKTRDELDNVNDSVKDTFTGLVDLLFESGDATEKLISAFAGLGKMFAKLGAEKLYDFLSGKSSSLFEGLTNIGGKTGSNVGGGVSVATARVSGTAIGETIAPPIVKSLDNGIDAFMAGIRKMESGSYGGNYNAMGPVVTKGMYAGDRAYGAYQVMGKNIASFTKEALGVSLSIQEFMGNKAAQDKVAYTRMQEAFDKLGNWADVASVWFSGKPLSKAKNRDDGYTTVPGYVSDVQSYMDAYPGGAKKAVSDGVRDGIRKVNTESQNDPWAGMRETSVAGGGAGLQNMLNVGGAALGAFAGGMQSGDPFSGAIGGAMSGYGAGGAISSLLGVGATAGGIIGIIGGAILGFVGGLIGKSKQKKAELKQAQQELESQLGAITDLMRTTTGNFLGSFEKSFYDTVDEYQKAITLAEKAKNKKLVQELKSSMNEFFDRLAENWNRSFQGTLDSLSAGLGMDGEFLKGMDAVEKMRESLVGFVNDAKFFVEANGDLGSMLDARKKEMGIAVGEKALNQPKDEWYKRYGGKDGTVEQHTNDFVENYKEVGLQLVKMGFEAFNEQGGQLYDTLTELKDAATKAGYAIDEQNKVTINLTAANDNLIDAVEKAQEAARASALAALSGGVAFTEIEQAIQRLEGAAAALPELLEDLGMSADDAAKAIEHHLNIALRDLRNNLSTDLTRSLNDLSGFSYLNEFLDAQVAYENRLRDLKALGMDTGIAMSELTQRLSNIAKEAELTDDNLTALAGAFPQLSGALLGLIGGSLGTPQQVLDDAKAKVEEAKDALRESFEKEISTLEEAKSAHDNYIKSIQKFLDDLKLDDQLSPLDPTQRFQEAQKQYLETTQLALSGDKDAIEKVEDVSRQYLEEARAYYGTSEGYFSIFNDVESTLSSILTGAKQHLSELEQQLAAMEAQRDAQLGTTDAVLSVEEAINRLAAATSAEAAAQKAYDSAQDAMIQQMLELLKQTGQAYDPFITSLYRDVLGRAPDAEGAAYYTNMLNSGVSQEEIRRRFVANAQPELDRGYPAFADGGYHAGGLRLVGERGPELEMTGASRIWNASDTSRILSQAWQPQSYAFANDNSAASLLKEVQALRQEVAAFREDRKEGDGIVAAGAQATVAAVSETTQSVRDQASAARRERGRRTA